MRIPENRLKHCYVAGKVMEFCAKKYGYDKSIQEKAFFLGYIHDAMYDFEDDERLHNEILSGYINYYSDEIKNHSEYTDKYKSTMLDWLYFADQVVDGSGNVVSFDERLVDIEKRHGYDDGVFEETKGIIEYLRANRFDSLEKEVISYFNK